MRRCLKSMEQQCSDELFCKISSRLLINSSQMLLHSEHSHKTCFTDLQSHSNKLSIVPCITHLHVCLPSSSIRPWIPDLNLSKSLEPMSETPRKYFLHLKSSFNCIYYTLSIYSSYSLRIATHL